MVKWSGKHVQPPRQNCEHRWRLDNIVKTYNLQLQTNLPTDKSMEAQVPSAQQHHAFVASAVSLRETWLQSSWNAEQSVKTDIKREFTMYQNNLWKQIKKIFTMYQPHVVENVHAVPSLFDITYPCKLDTTELHHVYIILSTFWCAETNKHQWMKGWAYLFFTRLCKAEVILKCST